MTKQIKKVDIKDFAKENNIAIFFEKSLQINLQGDMIAKLNSFGASGPYGNDFIELFPKIIEKCQKNGHHLAIIGVMSYNYFKENGKQLLEDMSNLLIEVRTRLLKNRIETEENSISKRNFKNLNAPIRFLVVYDLKKDNITFDDSDYYDYIDQDSLKAQNSNLFLKRLISETTSLKMHHRLLETSLIGQDVYDIGKSLGSERDIGRIMHNILINSMRITKADSGSIAIVGFDKNLKRTKSEILTYFVTINHSKDLGFSRFSMPISKESLGGNVVISKKILNIEDAYKLSPDLDYKFNRSFDEKTKYRTKSILVIPMINQKKNEVIGIIQLLNKKKTFEELIDYNNFSDDMVVPFTKEDVGQTTAITPFATIALQNALLYGEIDQLLLGFVEASVSAVEQRDPATSGHSFRVASYTINLAKACLALGDSLRLFHFNQEQQKEMEYAALLHDFGKIGVREHILIKPKKIQPEEIKNLLKRIEIHSVQKQLESERKKTEFLIKNRKMDREEIEKWIEQNERSLDEELRRIKRYRISVIQANEPSILETNVEAELDEIKNTWVTTDYSYERLLSDREYFMLKIRKGTLSVNERKEIESHVNHTYEFLRRIPWTTELSMVPEIALAHHEKLDGSGYPFGLPSSKIPAQTKIITVCDIFDALVASDRPYKRAVKKEIAFDILNQEAEEGKLEKQLVDVFIQRKIYKDILEKN